MIWLSWIRIRIGNADQDPEAWKLSKINKQTWFPAFQKAYLCKYISFPITYYLSPQVHVKILLFVTLKSNQDPDPHKSAMV
jgi:hypothetical protein